jgi:hypothetical protein
VSNKYYLLLLLAGTARAATGDSPVHLSGRAFEDLYLPTKSHTGQTFEQSSTSLWLQGDARASSAFVARAVYQGDLFANARLTGDRSGTHLRNRLREGWAEYFANGLEIRAGKQIIPWGKSDGINPTDFLSAHESSFLNHDAEVTRVGGVDLLVNFTPDSGASPWSLTAVAQPIFPAGDYLVPPAALPAGVSLRGTDDPDRTARNWEAAGKLAYAGSGWDFSASYFHGFDHHPIFSELSHVTISPLATFVNVHRIFERENAVGADASLSSGSWILRAESAYHFTQNDSGANPLLTPSHWDLVAGAERPFAEKFRVQAQFVSRYFPSWQDPNSMLGADAVSTVINREIAGANALLQQYQHKWGTASTLRVSYTLEDPSFTAEVLWYEGLNDGDYYLRPMVSYGFLDFLRVYLGLDQYGGPADKSVGSLQSYNAIFAELKAVF